MSWRIAAVALVLLLASAGGAQAEWIVRAESGVVFPDRNDVRVPNETGTRFSLTEDLDAKPRGHARLSFTRRWNNRHDLILLFAPLRVSAEGRLVQPVSFSGQEFPAGTDLDATYRFNSHRVTYRYLFHLTRQIDGAMGVTAVLRDAEIRVSGGGHAASEKDLGFVPLLHLAVDANLPGASLRLEADGLAGPRGRAVDAFLGVMWPLGRSFVIYGGYRMLEGGADVDEVYNFALFHYAVAGFEWML